MSKDIRPVEVGSRWEDRDARQGNRVVRIIRVYWAKTVEYEIEVAELNPKTVGRQRAISEAGLRKRYQRVSR